MSKLPKEKAAKQQEPKKDSWVTQLRKNREAILNPPAANATSAKSEKKK